MLKHAALILLLAAAVPFAQTTVAGDWLLTEDVYGNAFSQRLTLKLDGAALSGTVGRRDLEGAVTGNAIRFTIKNQDATDELHRDDRRRHHLGHARAHGEGRPE